MTERFDPAVEEMDATKHLTLREAAVVLGTSAPTVYRLRQKLGMGSPGRSLVVPRAWIEELEAAETEAQRRRWAQ